MTDNELDELEQYSRLCRRYLQTEDPIRSSLIKELRAARALLQEIFNIGESGELHDRIDAHLNTETFPIKF